MKKIRALEITVDPDTCKLQKCAEDHILIGLELEIPRKCMLENLLEQDRFFSDIVELSGNKSLFIYVLQNFILENLLDDISKESNDCGCGGV
jgi:hypothetical protein